MEEMRHEYKFLTGKYERKKKIKPRKMKLEKNERSFGQIRQDYKFMIGKRERKKKDKSKEGEIEKECSMDGRYEMLTQNVSRKM
jgi:hypothetical protein